MTEEKIINVSDLTQAAKRYDPILRVLPFFTLQEAAKALGLNIMEVKNEDVLVTRLRQAGGTGPYAPGLTINYKDEVMKFRESTLKPELVYAATKDNITNYTEKQVLVAAGKPLDHKSKQHPLEKMIVESEVVSHAEDVLFSLFHAERVNSTHSPMTAFTGFYPMLDYLVKEGDIAASAGNLKTTGAFTTPSSNTDYEAYENLVEFIRSAHAMLRSPIGGTPQLICAETVTNAARKALQNKLKNFEYPTMARLLECLRSDANCATLEIKTHECLGTGSKLVLQKAGNMDIGMNTNKSKDFMQVRNPFEDPNEVQFWIQAAYGTRVREVHQKKFLTNEQSNKALDLSGDYVAVKETTP